MVTAIVALSGCVETSPQTFTYTLELTITSTTGTVPSVEVLDDGAGVALVPAATVTTPWSYTISGDVDHATPRAISIAAEDATIPTGESFTLTAVYTEEGYTDPVSYTIVDKTAANSSGAEYRQISEVISLPHVP